MCQEQDPITALLRIVDDMPLFACYCPDRADDVAARLAARPEHLALSQASVKNGSTGALKLVIALTPVFSRAWMNDKGEMVGSIMIYRMPNLDAAWDRIKRDPYWTGNVWEKDECRVHLLLERDGDETMGFR